MSPHQKTLFHLPQFTQQKPPLKRSKKSQICKEVELHKDEGKNDIEEVQNDSNELEKQKRRQAWNESWTCTFEWAYFDNTLARIFCHYYKNDHRTKSEFGKGGSINIQHNSLTEHAKTRAHEDAKYKNGVKKISIEYGMHRSKDAASQATINLFATAYHVAREDLSFNKYPTVLELLSHCQCPHITKDLYHNNKSCSMFLQCISEAILMDSLKRIKASTYFSLMMDESTDISLTQHLIVYASFIEDFEPITIFLGLLEIQGGTSSHLYDSCKYLLSQLQLDVNNMVCLGTDGASAMIGHVNGLTTRMKRDNPYITSIHCIAHRTNLCLVDAVKKSMHAQEIDQIVNEIAGIFSKSALKSSTLECLELEFGCAILRMSRIHKVRWLSRYSAIHKVCESFEPLLVFLKSQNATLYAKLCNFEFIYCIHFMADILERLSILSKTFQSTFVDITSVVGIIEAEIHLIEMQFIDEPDVDMNATSYDDMGYHIIPDYGPLEGQLAALQSSLRGNTYRSIVIEREVDGVDLEKAISFQKEFSEFIIQNLLERFPDRDLISCFKALAPCCFLSGVHLKSFGIAEIETLACYYGETKTTKDGEVIGPLIDKVLVKKEYHYFKAQAPYKWKGRSLRDTWLSIGRNQTTCVKYPMLLRLAHISMLQCASTTACERGFSIQNTIKTKLQNCLSTKSVDALMRVSIEGPPLGDYDFSNAIQIWETSAKTSCHIYGESTRVHGIRRD